MARVLYSQNNLMVYTKTLPRLGLIAGQAAGLAVFLSDGTGVMVGLLVCCVNLSCDWSVSPRIGLRFRFKSVLEPRDVNPKGGRLTPLFIPAAAALFVDKGETARCFNRSGAGCSCLAQDPDARNLAAVLAIEIARQVYI